MLGGNMEAMERYTYIVIIIVLFMYYGINDCTNSNGHQGCAS